MYRLITFGALAVERDGGGVPALAAQRKALALLAVVAASGPAGISRDRLLALFWPESTEERARGALKQMLHSVRRQLGAEEVLTGTASLALNAAQIGSDVAHFTAALQSGRAEEAVSLYTGPFLDGVHIDGADEFGRWADVRRRELEDQYATALEGLARSADARGDRLAAVDWWRRRQAAEPLSSRVAVALMTALNAAGDQPAAIRHARVHELLVREEFGTSADPAVAALAAALVSESTATTSPAPGRGDQTAGISAAELAGASAGRVDLFPPVHAAAQLGSHAAAQATVPAINSASTLIAEYGPDYVHEQALAQGEPPAAFGRSRWRTRGAWAAGLTVATLLAALGWRQISSSAGATAEAALEPRRVAIAVFENRTGDTLLAPLGLMAADWVSRDLARSALVDVLDVGTLYVQPRSPTGERIDPRKLARRSGAGLVVEGRYYRTVDSVWFTASIVDVASGQVLRVVDPIGTATADPLAGVDELRQRVSTALGTILDPRAKFYATAAMRPPRFDAYQEYVVAQDLYWRGAFDAAFPHFRRAAELDSTFGTAAAWLTVNAASVGRCDIVDSVASVMATRTSILTPGEGSTLANSQARCASDWEEHNRLMNARLQLQPGSSHVRWVLAVGYRANGQPARAVALLATIDPRRDLGWMSDHAKVLYWRELTAARHALGDFDGELVDATQLARDGGAPLTAAYLRARALAGGNRGAEALAALETVDALSPEPALVAGTTGRMRPREVATPGWVLYQIATELMAHGAEAQGRIAAERALAWFERRADAGPLPPEQRFVFAHAFALLGRAAAGRALLDTLMRGDSASIELRGALGALAAAASDRSTAEVIATWLAGQPPRFPVGMPTFYRARIAALLGDSAHALDLLEGLPHNAHPYDLALLHSDPAFARLRGTPRFTRLVTARP